MNRIEALSKKIFEADTRLDISKSARLKVVMLLEEEFNLNPDMDMGKMLEKGMEDIYPFDSRSARYNFRMAKNII